MMETRKTDTGNAAPTSSLLCACANVGSSVRTRGCRACALAESLCVPAVGPTCSRSTDRACVCSHYRCLVDWTHIRSLKSRRSMTSRHVTSTCRC